MSSKPIRVLIVDDSPFTRKVFSELLNRHPNITVIGTARGPAEALEKVRELSPDVVTLDLFMPDGGGIAFLQEQMRRKPVPVVVVSVAEESDRLVLSALEAGAVEFVQKVSSLANDTVYAIGDDLAEKVIAAAGTNIEQLSTQLSLPIERRPLPVFRTPSRFDALVIGISTGGPQALRYLLPLFPEQLPVEIAIVLHMPVGFTEAFAGKLNELSHIEVKEAVEGLEMRPGRAVLAQGGFHLILKKRSDGQVIVHLGAELGQGLHRPSVDVMFKSAAEIYGRRVLAVIMTGMGDDGTLGAGWIKAAGGTVLAESKESSIIYGMPRSVVEAGLADRVVPLKEMARTIMETL